MKKILKKLYNSKKLNELESYKIFQAIINNKMTQIEITAVLIAMKMRKISHQEITGAVKAFQQSCIFFPRPKCEFADIVGTGGDGVNNINVSTISALIASYFGFKIIKHCNKGISSKLGSSDILDRLKINIHITPEKSIKILEKLNICFLFAPQYHTGFKYVNNIRRELKVRTIFNVLGPLLNPAKPPFSVIGVYSKKLLLPFAHVIKNLPYKRVIIIHSDGTDEMTLHSSTDIAEIKNKKISLYKLHPKDFGIKNYKKEKFTQNSPEKNYKIIKNLLQGNGEIEYENLIAMNTAILFKVFGYENLKENTKKILKNIRNGNIKKHINNLVQTGSLCKKIN